MVGSAIETENGSEHRREVDGQEFSKNARKRVRSATAHNQEETRETSMYKTTHIINILLFTSCHHHKAQLNTRSPILVMFRRVGNRNPQVRAYSACPIISSRKFIGNCSAARPVSPRSVSGVGKCQRVYPSSKFRPELLCRCRKTSGIRVSGNRKRRQPPRIRPQFLHLRSIAHNITLHYTTPHYTTLTPIQHPLYYSWAPLPRNKMATQHESSSSLSPASANNASASSLHPRVLSRKCYPSLACPAYRQKSSR